ncbi:hypothetical protein SAMN05216308_104218 [Nitrosospira sp. Nsp13]|nr:hypothetical protein SAMN05216308_104218 [Nitrosospira sp. Nsp13]
MVNILVQSPPLLAAELPFDPFKSLGKVNLHLPPPREKVVDQSILPLENEIVELPPSMRKAIPQSPLPPSTTPPYVLFPSLENVTCPTVSTSAAAYYLNRKPQTLRAWACLENGPIRPIRINGRLAWGVADIKRLHGGG